MLMWAVPSIRVLLIRVLYYFGDLKRQFRELPILHRKVR